MVKKDTTDTTSAPAPQVTTDASNSIPIIALVLGVVSLVTFMWFLGIVAIVLGIIGIRRYKENRGFSIAGLVTGIISTLLMIGAILFIITMIAISVLNSDPDNYMNNTPQSSNDRYDRHYNERYYQDSREGI